MLAERLDDPERQSARPRSPQFFVGIIAVTLRDDGEGEAVLPI